MTQVSSAAQPLNHCSWKKTKTTTGQLKSVAEKISCQRTPSQLWDGFTFLSETHTYTGINKLLTEQVHWVPRKGPQSHSVCWHCSVLFINDYHLFLHLHRPLGNCTISMHNCSLQNTTKTVSTDKQALMQMFPLVSEALWNNFGDCKSGVGSPAALLNRSWGGKAEIAACSLSAGQLLPITQTSASYSLPALSEISDALPLQCFSGEPWRALQRRARSCTDTPCWGEHPASPGLLCRLPVAACQNSQQSTSFCSLKEACLLWSLFSAQLPNSNGTQLPA